VASLALLAATLYILDWTAIAAALRRVSVTGLVVALLATLAHFCVMAWRWYLIVRRHVPRSPTDHLTHYFLATYLNTFTPANLGGDVYRVVALRSEAADAGTLVVAVLRERLLGLLSFLLAYLVFLAAAAATGVVAETLPPLFKLAGLVAGLAAAAVLLAPFFLTAPLLKLPAVNARPALKNGVDMLHRAVCAGSPASFAVLLCFSAAAVALWIATVKIVAVDLGIEVSWWTLGMVVVLTELLRMVPLTIQGIGLREATFAYVLGQLGGNSEFGFVLGAVSYAVLTVALLLCGLLGWWLLNMKRRVLE
jgi:uncharacterized membrane protein YbhN (UPF0104 family)